MPDDHAPSRYFVFALVLYVLIVVARTHELVPFLPRLYLGKLSALLLIAATWTHLDRSALVAALRSKSARCIGVITVLALLSVPGSFWPRESVTFFENEWSQALLLFVCVTAGFTDPRIARKVLAVFTVASALAASQLLLGGGLVEGGRSYIGGAVSSTYDANETAALFVMVLPYALLFSSGAGKFRWVARAAVPLLLAALLKTESRGGIVALGVLFIVVFATGDRRRRVQCVVLAAVAVAVFAMLPHGDLVQRFSDLFGTGTDYNFDARDGRLQIWKRGLGLMLEHPLFGVGVGTYEIANGITSGSWLTAHNAYIEIGVELGIAGFVTFVAMILYAVSAAWRTAHRPWPSVSKHDDPFAPRQVAYAVLASLLSVLAAAFFLSMAYASMTIFAIAAATGLAIRTGTGVAGAGNGIAARVPAPGLGAEWRTTRSAHVRRRHSRS